MSPIRPISGRRFPAAPSPRSTASSSAPSPSCRRRIPILIMPPFHPYSRFRCRSLRSPARQSSPSTASSSAPPLSSRQCRLRPSSCRSLVVSSPPSTPSSASFRHRRPLMPPFHPYFRFHTRVHRSHRSPVMTARPLPRLDLPSPQSLPEEDTPDDIIQHRMCATLYFLFFPHHRGQYRGIVDNTMYWGFAMILRSRLYPIIEGWTPLQLLQFDERKEKQVKLYRYACYSTRLAPPDEPSVPFVEWNKLAEDREIALSFIGLPLEETHELITNILSGLLVEEETETNGNASELFRINEYVAHSAVSEEEFKEYVEKMRTLPPANQNKLILYAFCMQATFGPPPARPTLLHGNVRKEMFYRAIWDVWKIIEVKTKEEAMRAFVAKMKQVLQESVP